MFKILATYTILLCLWCQSVAAQSDINFTNPDLLISNENLPDLFLSHDGEVDITTERQWEVRRRPELKYLLQHYEYGYAPPAPKITHRKILIDKNAFGGIASLYEVAISYENSGAPDINLLLAVPNNITGPAPVFLQLNKCGNQSTSDHPGVTVSKSWANPDTCTGPDNNRAYRASYFNLAQVVGDGYAVATFHESDIDPDRNDFTDGVHPHFDFKAVKDTKWGTIAAWAWGFSRAVDYLYDEDLINNNKIAVFGHSRRGKTALLAGALDERINLVISHQAGTGGTALSRSYNGESVKRINDSFPHWFNDMFLKFNERENFLPFDQHGLIALIAPRSILITNAVEDIWANPEGTYKAAEAAGRAWHLYGQSGLFQPSPEETNFEASLAYHIREGVHSVTPEDWKIFTKYADVQFGN